MTKPAGKIAFVPGSGREIGRAIALNPASEGARLLINDRDAQTAALKRRAPKLGVSIRCAPRLFSRIGGVR